mmetsp:Transcript_91868/g.259488  ORF Transcript_91868/g.259488 Transcript_91868/m.259488 type:complete len:225 (+) Transcript_91868:466-1140(+)|eukprot:CAMPEP_0117469182 /NCGR_PEP_ID=MMETSP0784-20121206/6558_1 /TAXON_ID=39447 /ORGANISM="" /LENGTH=224 /DNA_ID=CAMNT_0005263211 /DNA_START=370 /DNA_END=1044 /DNA_ORIENTATION=-
MPDPDDLVVHLFVGLDDHEATVDALEISVRGPSGREVVVSVFFEQRSRVLHKPNVRVEKHNLSVEHHAPNLELVEPIWLADSVAPSLSHLVSHQGRPLALVRFVDGALRIMILSRGVPSRQLQAHGTHLHAILCVSRDNLRRRKSVDKRDHVVLVRVRTRRAEKRTCTGQAHFLHAGVQHQVQPAADGLLPSTAQRHECLLPCLLGQRPQWTNAPSVDGGGNQE